MAFNPVFFVLFWLQVCALAVGAKMYVPFAAGRNLFLVCGAVFALEMVALFIVLFLRALVS